jgi:predicted CxxxxCH...CXXCH cytochrome family protein
MPQIKPSLVVTSLALALCFSGCGDRNSEVAFSPNSGHSSDWVSTHKVSARANIESCVECHGTNLDGGVSNVACTKCHPGGAPVGANASGCTSCHGVPPDGPANGTSNRKLSHDKHSNLPGVTCNTCHNGYGYGAPGHGTLASARLSIDGAFKAKAATSDPAYTRNGSGGVTCTNVSCHGGQPTPVWGVAITECASCHAQGTARQDPEYNSYYSGYSVIGLSDALGASLGATLGTNQHARHLKMGFTCTECHYIWKLSNPQHFGGIVSKTFTSPGNTIGGEGTKIGSYDLTNQTCSAVSCHSLAPANNAPWVRF